MSLSSRLVASALALLPCATLWAETAAPPARSLVIVGDAIAGTGGNQASPLQPFFDPARLTLVDRSTGNHSTRSFVESGAWAAALALVKPNDVVMIQFGAYESGPHIDDSAGGKTSLPGDASLPGLSDDFQEIMNPTTRQPELIHTFGWYLRQMVVETISRGGIPVLCSPGAMVPPASNVSAYSGWVRAIAEQQRVPYLDLTHAAAISDQSAVVAALKSLNPDPLAGFFSQQGASIPAAAPVLPAPTPPVAALPSSF